MVTYGAAPFLPLYFQDSLFVSPTESGLRMLPQMLGVTAATFGIGRLIARTGRYKPFPIIGSIVSVIGLLGVARITGSTPYRWLVVADDPDGLRRGGDLHDHIDRQPERRRDSATSGSSRRR